MFREGFNLITALLVGWFFLSLLFLKIFHFDRARF